MFACCNEVLLGSVQRTFESNSSI
uniref:Uncharacterized protein n=1 Tax=Anguilla anguilla TaxID=7936 RepID=A0A0E9RPL5_ANGAN